MKAYKFKATIQPTDHGHGFVFFPYDTQEEFGTRGQIRVKATFDGVPYAGALVKYGPPQHMLPIVTQSVSPSNATKPSALSTTCRQGSPRRWSGPGPYAAFEKLSTNRKEYCRWIADAKREETRQNRIVKAVQMLAQGVKTPG